MSENWKGELTEYSERRFFGTDCDRDRFIDSIRRDAERCDDDDDEALVSAIEPGIKVVTNQYYNSQRQSPTMMVAVQSLIYSKKYRKIYIFTSSTDSSSPSASSSSSISDSVPDSDSSSSLSLS